MKAFMSRSSCATPCCRKRKFSERIQEREFQTCCSAVCYSCSLGRVCEFAPRLGLPWYCPVAPTTLPDGKLEWTFRADVPGVGVRELRITDTCGISFEEVAARLENEICGVPGLICECCAGSVGNVCPPCMYATSFHRCERLPGRTLWRRGTLCGGTVDYQRVFIWGVRGGTPVKRLWNPRSCAYAHDFEIVRRQMDGRRMRANEETYLVPGVAQFASKGPANSSVGNKSG